MDLAMHSYGVFLQNQVVRHLQEEKDAWALLNGALHGRGAFLYVPSHACEEVSLELLASQDRWAYSRLMIYLAPHAELTIRVETKGKGKGHFFCEVICDRGARCRYKVLHCSPELSWGHSLRALLKRDSHLLASLYSEGSVWDQTSSKVRLVEEGSEAKLYALSRLDAKRRHGIASLVEHVAPHSVSHQQFHAILYGESRSHIEGKIYVHPHAMQTESYQLSRALLLSNAATLSFSPNLEVLADDVKASHGASIGQLDEESLFYLRSRGLPVEEARRHLLEAFVQEVALCLP
jgi:Fe-S cluster assembly protein SufD